MPGLFTFRNGSWVECGAPGTIITPPPPGPVDKRWLVRALFGSGTPIPVVPKSSQWRVVTIAATGQPAVIVEPIAPTTDAGPVSVASVNEFESKGYGTPIDANYVPWRWATGTDLHAVLSSLGANDILVLPEDDKPYTINQVYRTSDGTVTGGSPQTDRSGCRSKKGIVGLGPNARIEWAPGLRTYAAQTGTEGVREAMVECWTAGAYHANLTIKGRNIGGLAYQALKLIRVNGGITERVATVNHYGFKNSEPGEAFGILLQNHTGGHDLRRIDIDGRNPTTGVKEGSGGIHLVRGDAVTIDDCRVRGVRGHGVAHYWRLGPTTINRTALSDIGNSTVSGSGINAEVCGPNTITLNDCDIRLGNAASGNTRPHFSIVAADVNGDLGDWPKGSTPVYLNRVTHDEATLRVWAGTGGTYHGAPNTQKNADVHVTPAGSPVTFR